MSETQTESGSSATMRALIRTSQLTHAKKRDGFGYSWCKKRFIGPLLRKLERPAPNVVPFGPKPDTEIVKFVADLRAQCRACGGCKFGTSQ